MKHSLSFLTLLTAFALVACGPKSNGNADASGSGESAEASEPNPSSSPQTQTQTYTLAGKPYAVELQRQPAKNEPTVTDEFGTVFYDSEVWVRIKATPADSTLFEHRFTKSDFRSHIPAAVYDRFVLHGMAFSSGTTGTDAFRLGAQVGEPGMSGEGPAFVVAISLDGTIQIIPDDNDPSMPDAPADLGD
ncbi:MAG: DUF4738 domain-containing protein [Alloprevotella sp.]|nr:DUF4738 domain-containing protein [Alloprevotella sp.]